MGDSHTSFFSGLGNKNTPYMQPIIFSGPQRNVIPQFKGIRIGPATAYQLHNKIPILDKVIKHFYKIDDSILFCFGEVDCRIHLPKRIINGEDKTKVITECVERYFEVILKYQRKGVNCMVWGVIGSTYTGSGYPDQYKVGTMEERNSIAIEFNELLKMKCKEHNIKFISVFDYMVKDLKTDPKCLQDQLHLSQHLMPITIKLFNEQKD